MKHNFLKFLLAGMALLGTSINIWALDSHFSIVGNPTGGWDKKVNLDKTYSGRDGEFYTAIYIENNQYFALHNGSSQYGPNTNNSAIKNGSGGGQGTYNSNTWKFTGTNGLVMVCAAENNDREWYPYVYVEEHDIKLKHPWDGSSWSWSDAMTNKKNGTYELTATIKGASTGYNYGDGSNEYGWIATPTRNPTTIADGSKCLIVLDAKTFKITVTRYQTITYNINGGSGASAPSAQEQLYNQSITLAAMPSGLAKTGYNFTGWNTASDGTGDHYAAGETISNLTSDLTLYAEWTEKTFTVTAAKGTGCASVNPTGAQTVGQLTGKQFTATASTGYSFDSWTSNNGGTFSTQAATTTFKPTGAATITANFTEVLTSVTISSNGNGTVSPTSASVGVATTESVSATPADGYHFASWAVTGNADIKGATTSNPVTLYGNGSGSTGTLKATFAETLYTITIESGTAASTTAGCVTTGTATAAAAAEGKKFDKWDLGTGITLVGCAVTDQTITFHASQAATVTATYTDASKYNLNVVAGTGITSVSGSKTDQTILPIESEISATAKTGYTFAQWTKTGEGTVSYTSGSETSANATVSVTIGSVTLTASATPNNNTPYKVYHYQQNLADDDYTLVDTDNLTGTTDAQVTPAVKDYEGFTAPSAQMVTIAGDGSTVVEYQYARKSYNISYTAQATGWTYGTQPVSAKYGAEVSFVVTPTAGYMVTVSSEDADLSQDGNTYTFTMPAKAVAISVSATENMTTVTVNANETTWGTVSGAVNTWEANTSVGVTTTATVKATAKPGYKFVTWELANCVLVTGSLTDAQITIKGDGSSATGTAVATFAEDLTANWYIKGDASLLPLAGNWEKSESYRFSKPNKDASSAYIDIEITQEQVGSTYEFKLQDYGFAGEPMYGWGTNEGDYHTFTQTETFGIYNNNGSDHNLKITPSIKGTYRFSIDWSSGHNLTVTFPTINAVTASWNSWTQESNAIVTDDVLTYELQVTDEQLTAEDLAFKIIYGGVYYGATASGHSITATNHSDWDLTNINGNNIGFKPSIAGTYTFEFNGSTKKLNVTYPVPDAPASITVTAERYFGEDKINTFIETSPAYKVYTDESIKLTIDEVVAPTGCTTYYQFGTNAASTERTYTITNPTTAADQSIEAKVFFRPNAGGKDGDAKSETINYQGVPYPQLFLTSDLDNDETELDHAPKNVTISYTTANYSGSATIKKNDAAWKTATGEQQNYTEPLDKSIHADKYVATAEVYGRTFTTSLVVSVYKYVQVKVKDADPKWAKNVYMWKDGTDKKNAEWPGVALTTQLGDWYIFAVKYPTYDNFVINDGQEKGNQTLNLTIPDREICYEIGALDHEGDERHYYTCTEAAQCPNGLYVGDIANVEMYNGESTTVSPVVQLDPSLSEDDLHITFTYTTGGIVNASQSGKNILLSATSTGTTTVTATYSIDGAQSVSKTFSVTVTGSVLIQISVDQSYGWTDHGAIYIKYFNHGYDSQKNLKWDHYSGTQDYYSARIPLGSDNKIDFMVYAWKIEDEHKDHQTTNVTDVTTDGCYFVSNDFYDGKRGIGSNGSGLCWEEYQVKIVMGNGTTYYSNKVNNLNEIVSFYAPADKESGYKRGSVFLTHNGAQVATITGFAESNVYTAKVAANGLTDINVYNGPFYIRTDATSWNDYKKPDYQMNEFSLYDGAQYNYYWVGNHKNNGSFNIKGCVANQYNESLANMIEGANYTDGYGNIDNDGTFGVNLRFGYNPETNHFERSILKGSSDNEFLNVIGDNIFNEVGCSTKLNQQNANSKFSDISNWVYEKVVYAKIGEGFTNAQVKLLSKAFNGKVVYQFGYTVDPNTGHTTETPATRSIMATGTTTGTYQLRLIYDYKTNRLTAAWSPTDNQQIDNSIDVNADIMFMQKEHNDATRLLMGDAGKVRSLEYLLFILQIEKDDTRSGSNNNFEHYYISLPYDCMIQDIYGIEGFGEYWGIQKYDGAERARKGWFKEDTPEGFWKWMNRDEKLNGGEGYLLSVAKGWLKEDNKFSTIKDTDGKEISALRLYFPSYTKGYDLSKSSADESKVYESQRCNITSPVDRRKEDSNWRMIGSTAYNDITTNTVNSSADEDHKLAANYLYELQQVGGVWKYVAVSGEGFTYKAFQGYMYQFEGEINWQCYTKGEEENPASAPRYEAKRPAEKMRLSVMENETEVAHTFVELNENATKEFDFNLDLAYLASGEMDLYTEIENANLAANVTAYESQVIALHVDPAHYGTYTFHLDGANNVAVYLLDNMNGTYQLLSAGDVTVGLEEGSSSDRFALRFDVAASPTDSKNAKGETIINDGQKTQKLLINDNIYLINGGRIYNVLGARP